MKDSRMFMEWLDANGNKISIAKSAAVAATSKGDFTEKFKKLYSHIDSVWGGLNIIRCSAHTLAVYYGYGQKWYHLIIRYIPEEGCFEINLSERRPSDKLVYAGEADSWTELLDILMQTETIKNRKLCEWVDGKGNKISMGNSSVAQGIPAKLPETSHKEKFQKLLDYHKNHVGKDVIATEIKKISNYGFEYRETKLVGTSESSTIVEVDIHDDGEYFAYVWQDGQCIDLSHGDNFDTLLKLLDKYLNIPDKNSNEYLELVEWVDNKGNKIASGYSAAKSNRPTKAVNGGYKEKFKKLLSYHMNHLPPIAVDPEIKTLQDDEFIYKERHVTGDVEQDYDLVVAVTINEHSGDWDSAVYKNGALVKVDFNNGFEELLKSLRNDLSIPAEATADYQKLLEWIDGKGNKINFNNTAAAAPTNDLFKDRFTKLAKHIEDCHSWSLVNYMSEWELDLEYEAYGETYSLDIDVNSKNIKATVYKNNSGKEILTATANHDKWSKILASLWNKGIINDTSLCEWVDNNGNKISTNKPIVNNQPEEVVYIWDMYIDPRDKGTWCSAEEYNGEYDGYVFEVKEVARQAGLNHLRELEDEGELRGDPDDYDIDVIAIPKSKVSDYTLRFSGL